MLLPSHTTDRNSWVDKDGIHVVSKGTPPSSEEQGKMTKEYQKNIKKSPLWSQMVQEYGEARAEEMLKDFQVEIG